MGTIQLGGFISAINQYGQKHGLGSITPRHVRELIAEGVLPASCAPGQGRGKGRRAAVYSEKSFHAAILALELNKEGLYRYSQIRLWVFFSYLQNRPITFDIPEHLIKHDLQQEFKRLVKKASSGAEIFGQTSLSKRQKKIDVVVDSAHETPELSKKVLKKAVINWLDSLYGLGSNVPFVPDNFNHNVEHLFSNGIQCSCVLEENPILEGFNDLFPKEVPFTEWSIKVFQFMQYLIGRMSISTQSETITDFLDKQIFVFVSTLYLCHLLPETYGLSAEDLLFQPAEAGSQET